MRSDRLLSIVLTGIGFAIAVAAGLYLAVRLSRGEIGSGGVLVGAGVAFVPVAVLVGIGIYLYARSLPREEPEQESTIRQQRDILDLLRSQGKVSLPEVAQAMNVDVDAVEGMVRELIGLRVFSGYVDWQSRLLVQDDAGRLGALQRCQKCGSPIDLSGGGVITCGVCQTEYFLV